jgi:hypothetical protein
MGSYEFWDLGEKDVIRLSSKAMSKVMLGLIRVQGRLLDTHVDGDFYLKPQYCTALFRVAIPTGRASEFEEYTGLTLSPIPQVAL